MLLDGELTFHSCLSDDGGDGCWFLVLAEPLRGIDTATRSQNVNGGSQKAIATFTSHYTSCMV